MKKIKLFLASSSELKEDRQQFEIFINRKNKLWIDKGIFLCYIVDNSPFHTRNITGKGRGE